MPLWWRDDRVEGVEVRVAHDGENLAIHLSWNDAAENADQLHATAFGDGAAVQLSNDADPPFFGMGDAAGTVNIWHWKSAWEGDRPDFPDITKAYPRALMDFDMSAKMIQPSQGPHLVSEIKDRDPTFYSGWGAGNLVSSPERPSAVEDINAEGLGTVHSLAGPERSGQRGLERGRLAGRVRAPLGGFRLGGHRLPPGRKRAHCFRGLGRAGG